ncbi:MAG TPA: tetratricopeptide repeat protein, partial [Labilithrix sp.]|nr:tetratricopeptide repeat protein [Labilithrix sp.]
LSAALVASVVVTLAACGAENKQVVAPSKDAGVGTPVMTEGGGEVGVVDSAGGSGLTGTAKSRFEEGWQAWLKGDLQTAKKKFKDAGEADAKSPAPPYSLGVVLERLGDAAGAQQAYRTAFSNNPDHEISMCAYALSLAHGGHPGEADTFLNDKRRKKENSPRLTTCTAELKSRQNDHGTAQQLAQDALRMDPDFKDAMVAIARDHYRARKLDLAKYALSAILEGSGDATPPRDKDNAEAHLLRGLIYRESGSRAVALQDFEAAVKRRPDLVEALINLGSMRLEAGNASEASPVLESATRFAPTNAIAHLNLGDCYRLLGRYGDAKKEFDTALSLDSSLAAAHYDLGLMYLTAPTIPGNTADSQVATALKELETYRTMRGPKPPPGVQDDIDDLIARAKAKQAELKQTPAASAPPPAVAGSAAAPAASGAAPAASGAAPAAGEAPPPK